MRTSLFLAISAMLCLCRPAAAQMSQPVEVALEPDFADYLRVVEDQDGYANIRSGPSLNHKVLGKALSGSLVTTWDQKGEWARIEDDSGASRELFLHSSRLKKLNGWKQFKPARGDGESVTLSVGGLEVEVRALPFVVKDHEISRNKDGFIHKVDGHHIWGTDGSMPDKALALRVKRQGQDVQIPAAATQDLYQPQLDTLALITPGNPGEHAAIVMWNSDGAGGYMVAWSLVNGQYAGRTIFVP